MICLTLPVISLATVFPILFDIDDLAVVKRLTQRGIEYLSCNYQSDRN